MPPTTARSLAANLSSLKGQWQGLQPAQRRTVVGAALALLAAVLVWAGLSLRGPAMSPLFTNLSPQDGAAILTQLQHAHTPYRLANGGQTILVPAAQVDTLRLELAGQGLPNQGNVGLSSVLNLPFGATDFTRQVAYQNALQGELAQTIEAVQGVRSARVQIVLPQSQTFGGGGTPASAAVLVDMQAGAQLTSAQVAGIMHLVASSVQGLSPSGVTVIDQTGQILSATAQGSTAAGSALSAGAAQAQNDIQVQQQFDQQLQQELQNLLQQVFGAGNVVTQVNAAFNFNSGTVDETQYRPGKTRAVLTSMQELKQTVTGQGTAQTPAGTAANSYPPTYKATQQGGNSSSLQLNQKFDISREVTHTITSPGALSRMSVAVVINSRLTAAQLRLVRTAVEAAVGYSKARGDQISVVGLPFNQSLLNSLQNQAQPAPPQPLWARTPVLLGAIGVLVLLLLLLLLLRRRPEPQPEVEESPALPDGAPIPVEVRASPLDAALQAATAARREAEEALRERPEDVARVIRAWLSEDE